MSDNFEIKATLDVDADQAERALAGQLRSAVSNVEAELNKVEHSASSATTKIRDLGDGATRAMTTLGRTGVAGLSGIAEFAGKGALKLGDMALSAVKVATVIGGGALAALTGIGLKTAASLETAATGFNALLGSAAAGQEFFGGLVKVANQSSYEIRAQAITPFPRTPSLCLYALRKW